MMSNAPDKLSDTIKVIKGEHSGSTAHVMQHDWLNNNIKARLKKDDPKTAVMLKFEEAIFIKEKK